MMEHKGYHAAVTYDQEAGVFHGEIVGTRDVIFFEGTSVEELNKEFRFSIDDYLAMCAERGQAPDKPFSGKIPLRVSPAVHRPASRRQPRVDPALRGEDPSHHHPRLVRGSRIRPDSASRRLRLGQCEAPRQLIGSPLTARWCIT